MARKPRALDTADLIYLEFKLREGSNWAALGYVMEELGLKAPAALKQLEALRREWRIRRAWTLPAEMKQVRAFAQVQFPEATRYADQLFESRQYARAAIAYDQARQLNPGEPGMLGLSDHCTQQRRICRRRKG
jgi:hypothetical protein